MTNKNILVERSDMGEISLYDRTDRFVASCKEGIWRGGAVFDFDYLENNFHRITDEAEVLKLITEARLALGKPAPENQGKKA